jgi:hypothetical protein
MRAPAGVAASPPVSARPAHLLAQEAVGTIAQLPQVLELSGEAVGAGLAEKRLAHLDLDVGLPGAARPSPVA